MAYLETSRSLTIVSSSLAPITVIGVGATLSTAPHVSHALTGRTRLIRAPLTLNDDHREDITKVGGELWELYADLKKYKRSPKKSQVCPDAARRCLV